MIFSNNHHRDILGYSSNKLYHIWMPNLFEYLKFMFKCISVPRQIMELALGKIDLSKEGYDKN